jgi:hypothetical protein
MIRLQLDETICQVSEIGRQSALKTTTQRIEESALLVLPLTKLGWWMVPVFALVALRAVYEHFMSRTRVDTVAEIRRSVSGQMTNLALRAGTELEQEVRNSLIALQRWQEKAVQTTAKTSAETAVGFF